MNSKNIFVGMLFVFPISVYPLTFTNPFASPFKDPTHEEHQQSIKDSARVGALLLSASSLFFLNSVIYHGELPKTISVPLHCASVLFGIIANPFLLKAGIEYYNCSSEEKFLNYLAVQKKSKDYKTNIGVWRSSTTFTHALIQDKRLYLGTVALFAGFFTSFTEMNGRNPTFIFTVAGIGIIMEKLIAEL